LPADSYPPDFSSVSIDSEMVRECLPDTHSSTMSKDSENVGSMTTCSDMLLGDIEPVRMAYMRTYVPYSAGKRLDGASTIEAHLSDEIGPSSDVQTSDCSDSDEELDCSPTEEPLLPYEGSDGESEEYSSDEEDHIQEDSDSEGYASDSEEDSFLQELESEDFYDSNEL
jgi:hypothetical protein